MRFELSGRVLNPPVWGISGMAGSKPAHSKVLSLSYSLAVPKHEKVEVTF